MRIENFHNSRLRNDEHFQFCTEFKDAVERWGAEALKIETPFGEWLILYAQEDEALKKIMKSAITADIQAADKQRDNLFRGLVETNQAALKHFREEVQQAAKRLKIVFDTYGNLAQKPLNEQTSGVHNLLQDLNGRYADDAATVALNDWMNELQTANEEFARLVRERYDETALKTDLVLKKVRVKVDESYRAIVERINALTLVEGAGNYAEFIKYCNTVIAKYTAMVAKRAGKTKS